MHRAGGLEGASARRSHPIRFKPETGHLTPVILNRFTVTVPQTITFPFPLTEWHPVTGS
ncbi:MAG: hypothetical protein RIS70_4414 [Planctomycetota bacterium]